MKDTLKVLIPNGAVIGVVTLTDLEAVLKILLLLASLGYTIWNWCTKARERRYWHSRPRRPGL